MKLIKVILEQKKLLSEDFEILGVLQSLFAIFISSSSEFLSLDRLNYGF
jgi:hypothetical protein